MSDIKPVSLAYSPIIKRLLPWSVHSQYNRKLTCLVSEPVGQENIQCLPATKPLFTQAAICLLCPVIEPYLFLLLRLFCYKGNFRDFLASAS